MSFRIFLISSLLLCVVRAAFSPEESREIAMLKREEMKVVGSDRFEQLWHRMENMLDYEDMPVREAAETWDDILSKDVVYNWHKNGECDGLYQVFACFKHERMINVEKDSNIRSRNYRIETVQDGAIQSVRMDISVFRRGSMKPERVSELFWLHFSPEDALITRIHRWNFVE